MSGLMKHLQDKHLSASITKCLWSPKVDLLLVANEQGQVSVFRHHSLQRVWMLPPPEDDLLVADLAWRPDGNLIAISYTSGLILLVAIEMGVELHRVVVEEEITTITWHTHSIEAVKCESGVKMNIPHTGEGMKDCSDSEDFISSPFPSDILFAVGLDDIQPEDNYLSVLVVGTASSKLLFYAFGYILFAALDMKKRFPESLKIISLKCSFNFNLLSILVESGDQNEEDRAVSHACCDISILSFYHKEIFIMTHAFLEIQKLLEFGSQTLLQLQEVWESLMLEIDSKLDCYSYMKSDSIDFVADFMDLFIFGGASPEFSMYITGKLTEKCLKKLRQTAESSFISMRKLVVSNLQGVAQSLIFLLSHMMGISNSLEKCKPLGLSEAMIYEGITEAATFFMKANEIDEVISTSMKNLLSFLKWLSLAHIKCSRSSPISPELSKTCEKENTQVMNFLNDIEIELHTDKDGKKHRKMKVKSISQYFTQKRVKCPLQNSNNPWNKFLQKHPQVKKLPFILPPQRNLAISEAYSVLVEKLTSFQKMSTTAIGEAMRVSKGVSLFKLGNDKSVQVEQQSYSGQQKININIIPSKSSQDAYFLQFSSKDNTVYKYCSNENATTSIMMSKYSISKLNESVNSSPQILDSKFYDINTVSLLLKDSDSEMNSVFVQVPLSVLERSVRIAKVTFGEHSNIDSVLVPTTVAPSDLGGVQRLEVPAGGIGVSGERKMSVVIANGNRSISLYEMDVDEDDEEDADDTLEK